MLKVLDLFSGIGGFSLGLERAGMKTIAFCETNPFCRQVLRKHWPNVHIYEDIRELDATGIDADVVCGGWPCQAFSTAARGRNTAPDMWPEFFRVIQESKPVWVVAENVPKALDGWERISIDLESAGYFAEAVVMDTALPERQRARNRAIIVAHADGNRKPLRALHEEAPIVQKDAGRDWTTRAGTVGMADGVSGRMDRLRALGNAVVPQTIEAIGRAIVELEG